MFASRPRSTRASVVTFTLGAAIVAATAVVTPACDSRSVSNQDGNASTVDAAARRDGTGADAAHDASVPRDVTLPDAPAPDAARADSAPGRLDSRPADGAASTCGCRPGEVWRRSPCSPNAEIGCAPTCTPGACGAGRICDRCAAKPSCGAPDNACSPACVPDPNVGPRPFTGPVRLTPTSGPAGQQVNLLVEGHRFYIGALFYAYRINGGASAMTQYVTKPCAQGVRFTPQTPGVHTIEISQYGGGAPWVLAGFYIATSGAPSAPSAQPGLHCSPSNACVSGPGYGCACVSGRCACTPKP